MLLDTAKIRREDMRWIILLALYNNAPSETNEHIILSIVTGIYTDATQLELRKQLDYLDSRELVSVRKSPSNDVWYGDLKRYGTDLVEGNVECEPGIRRPADYRVK